MMHTENTCAGCKVRMSAQEPSSRFAQSVKRIAKQGCIVLALFLFPVPLSALSTASEPPKEEQAAASPVEAVKGAASALLQGKLCLDREEHEKAIPLLTASYEGLPVLGDYALLWRAHAYEKTGNTDGALADLQTLREKYRDSCLLRNARAKEIDLLRTKESAAAADLFESFIRDYPSDMEMKYSYARHLKENGKAQRALELFKEVYLSATPLSSKALDELSSADITAEDLWKRGKNLNTAWHFEEAEEVFRAALMKDTGDLQNDIAEGLALSLFRQKRYKESAEWYQKVKNSYWRARALFRAGDMDAFQAELPALEQADDKRVVSVLLAYGMKKRREGASEEALQIFNSALSRYPSAKEDALWSMGWTYYLLRDYRNASKVFSQLSSLSGDPKYSYWDNKCKRILGEAEPATLTLTRKNGHDFYAFLSFLQDSRKPPAVASSPLRTGGLPRPAAERVEILAQLGLKKEATEELLNAARKSARPQDLASISAYLKALGSYRLSLATIARVPYSEEFHDLFYPLGYWQEVEEIARERGLDPLLVLSVMREESRFAPDARSIAGARGLMQLMPQTAHRFNRKIDAKNAGELYNARTNILIGSAYLKHLLDRLGSIPLALAAYNGGEEAVRGWLRKGSYRTVDEFIEDIPYEETRNYVKKVMTSYFAYMRARPDADISFLSSHMGELEGMQTLRAPRAHGAFIFGE